jgi:N-acetylmuramoyl-L-alanine amidase
VSLFATPASALSYAKRKQVARTAFEQAERMREALNGRPAAERSRREYQRAIDAYRKVYYTDPASSKADGSVLAVAELMAEAGSQMHDEKLLRDAIGQYEFLRREYPGSKFRFGALLSIGQIYQDELGDIAKAKATFDEFLRRYPHHASAGEARDALTQLAADAKRKPTKKATVETARAPSPPAPATPSTLAKPLTRPERRPLAGEQINETPATRKPATISVETGHAPSPSEEQSAPATTSSAVVARSNQRVHVTGVRHWSTPEYTRVAIDLDSEVPYEAGRVPNPDRVYFDLHGTHLAAGLMGKEWETESGLLKKIRVAQFQPGNTRVVLEVGEQVDYAVFFLPNPSRMIVDLRSVKPNEIVAAKREPIPAPPSKAPEPTLSKAPEPAALTPARVDAGVAPTRARVDAGDPARVTVATTTPADINTLAKPATTDDSTTPKPPLKPAPKTTTSAKPRGPAVHEAQPTSAGDRSLIRALGLKIGRIVVDAGHGGHDTGTIGPTGYQEKDLVLDVALRLGKLLENRMGADVVYTRDDDTFIPLETRTAIANREQADLFISIHANSSNDAAARGVETYYLNFTSSAEALEVAARENAVSDKSIHELQDLVKKIALKEKIEESREFASDVQRSLHSGLTTRNAPLRDRGVKKAPFIVLIGANMPSILAEISFVSNPTDERRLKTPEYRQKIAESLYRGLAKYVSGLSGVKVAAAPKAAGQ